MKLPIGNQNILLNGTELIQVVIDKLSNIKSKETQWVESLELYSCPNCKEKTVFKDGCPDCEAENV